MRRSEKGVVVKTTVVTDLPQKTGRQTDESGQDAGVDLPWKCGQLENFSVSDFGSTM